MHEDVMHNCLLGCNDAPDSLGHYVSCNHMHSINKFITRGTSEAPLIRWGISEPTVHNLKVVCCSFSGYHALKARLREQQTKLSSPLSPDQLRSNWNKYAEAFCAEADELSISTRQFSVASFLAFHVAGSPDNYSASSVTERLPSTVGSNSTCSPCLSQGAKTSQSQSSNQT